MHARVRVDGLSAVRASLDCSLSSPATSSSSQRKPSASVMTSCKHLGSSVNGRAAARAAPDVCCVLSAFLWLAGSRSDLLLSAALAAALRFVGAIAATKPAALATSSTSVAAFEHVRFVGHQAGSCRTFLSVAALEVAADPAGEGSPTSAFEAHGWDTAASSVVEGCSVEAGTAADDIVDCCAGSAAVARGADAGAAGAAARHSGGGQSSSSSSSSMMMIAWEGSPFSAFLTVVASPAAPTCAALSSTAPTCLHLP